MKPLTEPEIRAAFVNCSKGEAKRAGIPRDLSGQPWEDLDLLGWRDPQSPERAYLAAEIDGTAELAKAEAMPELETSWLAAFRQARHADRSPGRSCQ